MSLPLLCLALLCFGSAQSSLDFNYERNVSGSVSNKGWQYRQVSLKSWDSALWLGANYLSVGVHAGNGSALVDIIAGSVYINTGDHPLAFLSYFQAVNDWNLPIGAGNLFATFTDFSAALGYIGSSYLRIEESNPNGDVVAYQSLRGALVPSASNGLNWDLTDKSSGNGDPDKNNLKYVTFTGTLSVFSNNNNDNDFSVSISFIASNVAGVLNQSSTVVGPKSFESVVQIQNWPYKSASNSLTLVIGVGTGDASLSGSGHSLISKSSGNQVYFTLSKIATIEGANGNAKVSFSSNATSSIENLNFIAQLEAKYGGKATYKIARVTFPANASDIIYDPSIGAGETMEGQADSSTASTITTPSVIFAVAILVLAYLF